MQIILSFILSIFITIFFIYHYKIWGMKMEGMVGNEIKVRGDMQPEPKSEIYNFNLRQALGIWKDIGCTDGSYKPTANNEDIWKDEFWREKLKAYKTEADKYEKEHNYYDFIGKDIDGITNLQYGNIDLIGIGKAYNRCYDKTFKTTYNFPKAGDRIKIKENTKSKNTKYYSGIVLDGNVNESNPLEVLWSAKGVEGTNYKDVERNETKSLDVQTDDIKIKEDSVEFGWPYQEWNRHPDPTKKSDSAVSNKDWIKMNNVGKVDPKIVYKSMECLTDTKCDNLNCAKRKEEILNRYPITYYCKSDTRNKRDLGTGYICNSGGKKGMITQYFDKDTMCFSDEQGNEYGRKFAKQECGVGKSKDYNGKENLFKTECYAFISDKTNGRGNRAIIGMGDTSKEKLKQLGLTNGVIKHTTLYGEEWCSVKFPGKKEQKKTNLNLAPSGGATSINIFKQEKACELVINNNNKRFYDKDTSTGVGLSGGTKFNSSKLKENGIGKNATSNINLKHSGGSVSKCKVALYDTDEPNMFLMKMKKIGPFTIPFPNIPKIYGIGKRNIKNKVSSVQIFKQVPPILKDGKYKIRSNKTGRACSAYKSSNGEIIMQCNSGYSWSRSKNNEFYIKQVGDDPYLFNISSVIGKKCGATEDDIRCDNKNKVNLQFKILPVDDKELEKYSVSKPTTSYTGKCKIKSKATNNYCYTQKNWFYKHGGHLLCDASFYRSPDDFTFIKL